MTNRRNGGLAFSVSEIGERDTGKLEHSSRNAAPRSVTIRAQAAGCRRTDGSDSDRQSGRCVASRGGDVRLNGRTPDERPGDAREDKDGHRMAFSPCSADQNPPPDVEHEHDCRGVFSHDPLGFLHNLHRSSPRVPIRLLSKLALDRSVLKYVDDSNTF